MSYNTSSSSSSSTASTWLHDLTTAAAATGITWKAFTPFYLAILLWSLRLLRSTLESHAPPATASTPAYILPSITRHARFLPTPSRHAFHYPVLYLAVRLDQLEARQIDAGHAFAWKGALLQPEFVDETALAAKKSVTPAGRRDGSSTGGGDGWKAQMRAAERIERKRLEEKRTRNDRNTWSWTGLHPHNYLRATIPPLDQGASGKAEWIQGSILLKLAYELKQRGFLKSGPQDSDTVAAAAGRDWRTELGHVWTVTMPSIAGISGINPLTVHYCYRPHGYGEQLKEKEDGKRGVFWLVVLEVHNTFGERHMYVLESGKDEDTLPPRTTEGEDAPLSTTTPRGGYDHQWTFARSFHVSPFNDRGGFYRLFLKEPFSATAAGGADGHSFKLGVRLLLLVESSSADDVEPKLEKKLMATLDSLPPAPLSTKRSKAGRHVRPLCAATLYAALLRQPVDLFLTFARILYEAAKLHFSKRLDAFGRPDMVQSSETAVQGDYDGVGLPPALNQIQPHRSGEVGNGGAGAGAGAGGAGGLHYPAAGWTERVAKEYISAELQQRVEALTRATGEKWTVRVESTDPADGGLRITSPEKGQGEEKTLVLYTRSHSLYTDLMTYSPPRLALLLGSIVGRRWGVNSLRLFDEVFPSTATHTLPSKGVRKWHVDHLLAPLADRTNALALLQSYGIRSASPPKQREQQVDKGDGWRVNLALWIGWTAAVAEKNVFEWLGARYVRGTEPWLELQRGIEYLQALEHKQGSQSGGAAEWDTRLGSVYRR